MSIAAARKVIMEAQRAGKTVRPSKDEAFPVTYQTKIVVREHEIDNREQSRIKKEISDLKRERDYYKDLCFSGGGKVLIETLTGDKNQLKLEIQKLKSELESKKILLKEQEKDFNEKRKYLVSEHILLRLKQENLDLIKSVENERDTILKQSKIIKLYTEENMIIKRLLHEIELQNKL